MKSPAEAGSFVFFIGAPQIEPRIRGHIDRRCRSAVSYVRTPTDEACCTSNPSVNYIALRKRT